MHLNMLILEKTAHATKPTKTESTLEVMLMLPHKTLMLFMKLLLSPQSLLPLMLDQSGSNYTRAEFTAELVPVEKMILTTVF